MKTRKYALEIRTSTADTGKICAWYSQWFNTSEELTKELDQLWELKAAYSKTHVTEIEWKGEK